jgi:hypothetical protein
MPKPVAAPLPASRPQPKPQTDGAQVSSQQVSSPPAPTQAALSQAGGQQAAPAPPAPRTSAPDLMAGASPAVPSNSFEGRWGAIR